MHWRTTLIGLSVSAVLAVPFSGHAEDILDAPEVTIATAQEQQGLYLRSDIGSAPWSHEGDPRYRTYDAGTARYSSIPFNDARFGEPVSGSIGVGYQFTDMLRGDVTGEYFDGRFEADSRLAAPCAGETAGTGCDVKTGADFKAIGLMANVYADLGTLSGFTPYIGGGLGATHLRFGSALQTTSCVDAGAGCTGSTATATYNGDESWRVTYALMAGVSYDVSDRLKLDLGYRYSHIGSGDMFGFGAESLAGAEGAKGLDDGLGRHELRAGLRLSLW